MTGVFTMELRLRLSRLTMIGVLLVLVQSAVRAALLFPGNYWQDDFAMLASARKQGLELDYLFQNYNGHLMPGGFFLNWLVASFPGSYLPAALLTFLLQVVASILMLLLLRKMFGHHPGVLVGFAVYLFTPLALASVMWWAAAINALPLQIALCLGGLAVLKYREERRAIWLLAIAGALLFGFAFWEKAVMVPVFCFLLVPMVQRGRFRDVIAEWRRLGWAWALMTGMTLVYAGLYLTLGGPGGGEVPTLGAFARIAKLALIDTLLVGIVGGPWQSSDLGGVAWPDASLPVVIICLQVVLALAVLGYLLCGRRSLVGWGVLAVYLFINLAITAWGRGFWGELVGRDPRYIADALPLVGLVIAFLLTPHRDEVRRPWLARHHRTALPVIGVLLVFNSCLITTVAIGPQLQHPAVGQYIDNVRDALREQPTLTIVDSGVPPDVMIPLFGERARVSSVLGAYDLHPSYGQASSDLKILDDTGRPQPIRLIYVESGEGKGVQNCGLALGASESGAIELSGEVPEGRSVLRVGYYTSMEDGSAQVETGGRTHEFRLQDGLHVVWAAVSGPMTRVEITNTSQAGVVCFTDAAVGHPVPDLP